MPSSASGRACTDSIISRLCLAPQTRTAKLRRVAIVCKEVNVIMCRATDIREMTSEVLLLRLEPVNSVIPDSKPGQYLEAVLPGGERIPLSVANRPGESTPWIELHLHHGPERRRIGLLLETLRSAGIVAVNMPRGDVWFEMPLKAPLLLLASGTGVAQSKAVIEAVMASTTPSEFHLSLIWSARTQDDFYLRDKLQAWCFADSPFEFVLFAQQGRGMKELYAIADAERKRIGSNDVLVSGSPVFVAGCQSHFESIEASDIRIYSDVCPHQRDKENRGKVAVLL